MMNLEHARRQMIEQQIRAWEVLDPRVLDAMERVPRELFVPAAYGAVAFGDLAIPLPYGQCMLPPSLDGRLLQSLLPQRGDRVLEVGTGSGYLAACLGELAARVESIEIVPELAQMARVNLAAAAAHRVSVLAGDAFALADSGPATSGRADAGGYDAIALTGSLPVYDPRFERMLSDGGRLFAIVGPGPMMEAWLVTRLGAGDFRRENLFETFAAPLLHAPEAPKFVF